MSEFGSELGIIPLTCSMYLVLLLLFLVDTLKILIIEIRENFTLSKTEEYGSAIDSEVPTNELGSDDDEANRSDDGEGTSFF